MKTKEADDEKASGKKGKKSKVSSDSSNIL